MNIKALEDFIKNSDQVVIGIDGPAGAGKTMLSEYLLTNYDVTLFHVDDYFLPEIRKTKQRLREPGGNFDYERMEKEIFHHINDSEIISNAFNCKTGELEYRDPIKRHPIVVVEGVYALHPRFIPFYDFTVFVDVDEKTQQERILRRNGKTMFKRFIDEFIPLENMYFDAFKLRKNVDLLIN